MSRLIARMKELYRRLRMAMPCWLAGHEPGEIDPDSSYVLMEEPRIVFRKFWCSRCRKPIRLSLKPTRWE